jgi:hypothetical protein
MRLLPSAADGLTRIVSLPVPGEVDGNESSESRGLDLSGFSSLQVLSAAVKISTFTGEF